MALEQNEVVKVEFTRKELGYFYNRMRTNRWYENYYKTKMCGLGCPWEPWMADTLEKLTPYKL